MGNRSHQASMFCSYPQHLSSIIDVVHVRVVVLQVGTEHVKASANVAVLQMDQEDS